MSGISPRDLYQERKESARRRRNGEEEPLTKAQERAQRALESARHRDEGDIMSSARRGMRDLDRGTSIARVKRHGNVEEEDEELDRRSAEARIGLAPPLPQSILHPKKSRE